MKRFKQLEWEDFVGPSGQKEGLIYLKCYTGMPGFEYIIGNAKKREKVELFFEGGTQTFMKKIESVEEGKKLAQEDFENYIIKTFFEQD